MTNLAEILVPISICVVLPIVVVSLTLRQKMNRDNVRKDIILAALEKNADVDVEELVRKITSEGLLEKFVSEIFGAGVAKVYDKAVDSRGFSRRIAK